MIVRKGPRPRRGGALLPPQAGNPFTESEEEGMPGVSRALDEPRSGPSRLGFKSWIGRALRVVLGDYAIWRIYRCDLADHRPADLSAWLAQGYQFREVSRAEIEASGNADIRARAFYAGEGAHIFAVCHRGEIVCLECFWHGERYRQRNFWPLEEGQAKAVEIYTAPEWRGKGLATALKAYTDGWMKEHGFRHLFSRVWFTNRSSCRMSEKAGWKNVAIVAEFTPFRLNRTIRLIRRK